MVYTLMKTIDNRSLDKVFNFQTKFGLAYYVSNVVIYKQTLILRHRKWNSTTPKWINGFKQS